MSWLAHHPDFADATAFSVSTSLSAFGTTSGASHTETGDDPERAVTASAAHRMLQFSAGSATTEAASEVLQTLLEFTTALHVAKASGPAVSTSLYFLLRHAAACRRRHKSRAGCVLSARRRRPRAALPRPPRVDYPLTTTRCAVASAELHWTDATPHHTVFCVKGWRHHPAERKGCRHIVHQSARSTQEPCHVGVLGSHGVLAALWRSGKVMRSRLGEPLGVRKAPERDAAAHRLGPLSRHDPGAHCRGPPRFSGALGRCAPSQSCVLLHCWLCSSVAHSSMHS